MKRILLVGGFLTFSIAMYAQHDATAVAMAPQISKTDIKSTPPLLVLKEEAFDFGKIPQGKPVHHVFLVTNADKQPLKIANVQASCGCTTPDWDKENAILPGQDGKITVGYNAAAEGPFTKVITITYNETQTSQLTIKGEVWKTPAQSAPENKALDELKNN